MCGIAGFVGVSTNPGLTFELSTNLFKYLQIRGKDAAGYWGTTTSNSISYYKEPTASAKFVKKSEWLRLKSCSLDMLLMHARKTSSNSGSAKTNENNHPFVGSNGISALIHNGVITDEEYNYAKNNYNLETSCDSESLLKAFESFDPYLPINCPETLFAEMFDFGGLKRLWSIFKESDMAVAIGKINSDFDRNLWLFRNAGRPLWIIDTRKILGQIFFCSTAEIWSQAVKTLTVFANVNLIKLPSNEIWLVDKSCNVKKFAVNTINNT